MRDSAAGALMSPMTTFAPALYRIVAVAAPMPVAALVSSQWSRVIRPECRGYPETTTTLFLSFDKSAWFVTKCDISFAALLELQRLVVVVVDLATG